VIAEMTLLTKAPGAQFEISVDGKPRSYRDRKAIAIRGPAAVAAARPAVGGGFGLVGISATLASERSCRFVAARTIVTTTAAAIQMNQLRWRNLSVWTARDRGSNARNRYRRLTRPILL